MYVNKFVVYGYRERNGKFTRESTFKNFLLAVSTASEGELVLLERGQLADLAKNVSV